MDWWQPVSMVGTLLAGMTALAALGWRVLERMRIENQAAHDAIGKSIVKLRDDLTADMAKQRDDLTADMAKLRDDFTGEISKLRDAMTGQRDDLTADMAKLRDDLTGEISKLRDAMTGQRDDLTADMAKLRDDLTGEIAGWSDKLGAEIALTREGLVGVREGIAELRGELKGVNRSLLALQEDFRAHVFRGSAPA